MTSTYAHLFTRGRGGAQYIFVKNLGDGIQSCAQLVLHLQSGELCVRKVAKYRLFEAERQSPDGEKAALTALQKRVPRTEGQPNIVQFYEGADVPSRRKSTTAPERWHRESYFRFYNGGDLRYIYSHCKKHKLAVPRRLILKLTQQITFALNLLYAGNPPVFHNDLNMGNIFLNWDPVSEIPDAYVGDFGVSTVGGPIFGNWAGDLDALLYNVRALGSLTGTSVDEHDAEMLPHLDHALGGLEKLVDRLRQEAPSVQESRRAREADIAPSPPDMADFLSLLSQIPIPLSGSRNLRRIFEVDREAPVPKYYGTPAECLRARRVLGPWYLAEVRTDREGRPVEVIRTSDRTYHRPNPHDETSDTEIISSSEEDSSLQDGVDGIGLYRNGSHDSSCKAEVLPHQAASGPR